MQNFIYVALLIALFCPQAVPFDMSLASVKKYIWRRSDDPVFTYKVLDPMAPLPMPVFTSSS
ncbi:hypothetical protein DUNSADRAFT_13282 [Dunaliella salina]|uniref:Uncharacterized protein n=1 Tax=Dunaliella salina TaxID=3046 RepID=A0ABQ7G9R4_DUNSA|nr:hypothetical protein DUNSADRAFT_13282 [Dunaliella salina]|eukprot:KAF5831343.1 hypothetical protein DUNSADRAFT_13282 [Dunaliella salina]